MNDRRVVITGTGIISCVGHDVTTFWDSLVNGRCGLDTITKFDVSAFRSHIGGEIKDFDITQYMPAKEAKRLDHVTHLAIAAATEAVKQAGLPDDFRESNNIDPTRAGVVVSSGIGGLQTLTEQVRVLDQRGAKRVSPLLIPMMIIDTASGCISMRHGAQGPNMSIVTACSSACHSIGESFWMIKRDDADIMITGGSEASVTEIGFGGFCSMKAMSCRNDDPKHASRPFDAERDGFVMSDGAGVLVLEELEHAQKRGANILAEIVGYGATGDAFHITSPDPNGMGAARAVMTAMKHAGMNPEDIDYINAHGTSTPLNDKFETKAIKAALGEHAWNVAISSTKGVTGHALGAAGGFETIACVNALKYGIIPPTINYENPDPNCDLNYTPNTACEKIIKTAININLGFGGHNGALLLKRFDG